MARRKFKGKMAARFANRERVVGNARITVKPSYERFGFRACVAFGKSKMLDGGRVPNSKCAYGKNPRKAIAAAFHAMAGSLGRRKGAFAGRGR